MPPKNKHSKRLAAKQNVESMPTFEQTQQQQQQQQQQDPISQQTPLAESPFVPVNIPAESTGNEEHNKDIFIEIEPKTNTNIKVTDQHIPNSNDLSQQQVADVGSLNQAPGQPVTTGPIESHTQPNPTTPHSETSGSNEIEDESSLSASVTRLSTTNGAEVYLLGTAHFSPQSVQDVQKVIRAIRPSSVILELCRERAFMLSLDEESLLEQNKNLTFEKIRNAIAQRGLAQGLIFILFIKMSANLTEKLGLAPGAEFRAGSTEALKIPGCGVVLGDRSLQVTVARACASVSLWQKIKLLYQVLATDFDITQTEVEKCKDKDILEQLLKELGGEFPGFKKVLLDERNIYLAHSIYSWAQRSETSLGPPKVVAVVGIGHVAGIVENWGKTSDEQIRELNQIPETSLTRKVVGKTIKYGTLALLIYVGYRAITPTHIQSAICDKVTKLVR